MKGGEGKDIGYRQATRRGEYPEAMVKSDIALRALSIRLHLVKLKANAQIRSCEEMFTLSPLGGIGSTERRVPVLDSRNTSLQRGAISLRVSNSTICLRQQNLSRKPFFISVVMWQLVCLIQITNSAPCKDGSL